MSLRDAVRFIAVLVILVVAAADTRASGPQTRASAERDVVVVYLVRHAEKESNQPDPGLTAAGRDRAESLARLLASAKIDRILSSDYRRTRETASPLAEALDLELELYDPRALGDLAGTLRARPGRHLVVGHSNTTPQLVELLGGDPGSTMDEQEYDRLYIVMLDTSGGATTMLLRYGEPYEAVAEDTSKLPGVTVCSEPRPEICTMQYDPVCGRTNGGQEKTYSNGCSACSEVAVVEHRPGPCE